MVLRLILGAILLGMAVGQFVSWQEMPEILAAYQAMPDAALRPFAVALLLAEAVSGMWFLARPRSQALTPVWCTPRRRWCGPVWAYRRTCAGWTSPTADVSGVPDPAAEPVRVGAGRAAAGLRGLMIRPGLWAPAAGA